jgi:hypothetical protein
MNSLSVSLSKNIIYKQDLSKCTNGLSIWTEENINNGLFSIRDSWTSFHIPNIITYSTYSEIELQSIYGNIDKTIIPQNENDRYKTTGKVIRFSYGDNNFVEAWSEVIKENSNLKFYIATINLSPNYDIIQIIRTVK